MAEVPENGVKITLEGPVRENLCRVIVEGLGAEETFYVDNDDMEEFDELYLKIETLLEFAGSDTRRAIENAEVIIVNDEEANMEHVADMLTALKALKI